MENVLKQQPQTSFARIPLLGPVSGLAWRDLFRAYRVFLSDSPAGIRAALQAFRPMAWQAWVNRRLVRQAGELSDRLLSVDMSHLETLPPDTLGGAYARHMHRLEIDPDEFSDPSLARDWLERRTNITHDVQHLLLGYDIDEQGEVGVAAYALAQRLDPLNAFVLSFVPLLLLNPAWTLPVLRALWRGWRIGRGSQPLIGFAVEDHWETPLSQVRSSLGIPEV